MWYPVAYMLIWAVVNNFTVILYLKLLVKWTDIVSTYVLTTGALFYYLFLYALWPTCGKFCLPTSSPVKITWVKVLSLCVQVLSGSYIKLCVSHIGITVIFVNIVCMHISNGCFCSIEMPTVVLVYVEKGAQHLADLDWLWVSRDCPSKRPNWTNCPIRNIPFLGGSAGILAHTGQYNQSIVRETLLLARWSRT